MSRNPIASYTMRGFRMGAVDFKDFLWEALLDPAANVSMGDTAENLARQYQITRPQVDAFAVQSFERALAAQRAGFFAGEITPVTNERFERQGYQPRELKLRGTKELATDTHVRPSPLEALAGIRPAFGGVQTGGNSSAIVDGAAAALVASSDYAKKRGKPAAGAHRGGRHRRRAARGHGHRPGAGDQGRARARRSQLADIDRFEINEAFGAQVMACARELGIDEAKLNVNGGAIAIGHPLGATGVRLAHHAGARARPRAAALRHRIRLHRRRPGHRAADREPRRHSRTEELNHGHQRTCRDRDRRRLRPGRGDRGELARAGAKVACLDVNLDGARAVAEQIGGFAVRLRRDRREQAAAALAQARDKHGAARILINCAGVGPAKRIVGRDGPMPLADFERVIDINLIGTFNMMRLAAADMQSLAPLADGERGVIISTASVAAFEGQIGQAAYSASKGGVAALTMPAAREFAQFGIRVNAIAPGIFHTPMLYGAAARRRRRASPPSVPFPKLLGRARAVRVAGAPHHREHATSTAR